MKRVILQPGREKLALNRHPWVFSGAVARTEGGPSAGEVVPVYTAEGGFVAQGQFNPTSKIRLRLLEWSEAPVDEAWYRRRLEEAWALRSPLAGETDALRVFFSESDGIPGLIADLFGGWLVTQFLTSGANREKERLVRLLAEVIPGVRGIWEKSDGDGRRLEGLPEASGLLWGEAPPGEIEVHEHGRRYLVDPTHQKTGFYADQRDNRQLVAPWLAGRDVLDAFTFTGGFAVAAMASGARSVSLLDSSADALAQARRNLALGGWSPAEVLEGDAFQLLRDLKKRGQTYGAVVLDPPKLATSREHLEKALRGYKDLNLQALKLVEPGGYLASFSCSGLVDHKTFRDMIAFAAKDSGRRVDVVRQLHQSACHPVRTSMPEAEYLKGVLLRVL